MSKLIRFDEDHYGYLVDVDISQSRAHEIAMRFAEALPGKKLVVLWANEFIDLSGRYELTPMVPQPGPPEPDPSLIDTLTEGAEPK